MWTNLFAKHNQDIVHTDIKITQEIKGRASALPFCFLIKVCSMLITITPTSNISTATLKSFTLNVRFARCLVFLSITHAASSLILRHYAASQHTTATQHLKYKLKRKAFYALTGLFAFRSILKRRCNGLPTDKCPILSLKCR